MMEAASWFKSACFGRLLERLGMLQCCMSRMGKSMGYHNPLWHPASPTGTSDITLKLTHYPSPAARPQRRACRRGVSLTIFLTADLSAADRSWPLLAAFDERIDESVNGHGDCFKRQCQAVSRTIPSR